MKCSELLELCLEENRSFLFRPKQYMSENLFVNILAKWTKNQGFDPPTEFDRKECLDILYGRGVRIFKVEGEKYPMLIGIGKKLVYTREAHERYLQEQWDNN